MLGHLFLVALRPESKSRILLHGHITDMEQELSEIISWMDTDCTKC